MRLRRVWLDHRGATARGVWLLATVLRVLPHGAPVLPESAVHGADARPACHQDGEAFGGEGGCLGGREGGCLGGGEGGCLGGREGGCLGGGEGGRLGLNASLAAAAAVAPLC